MDKELQLAYLAGALDGDGSFSLLKKVESRDRSPLYYPMIQLANSSKDLIDHLVENFGGFQGLRDDYIAKDGFLRKKSYYWKVEKATKCLPLLEDVIPFLVVKKERAAFLRDYILDNPFIRGSNRLDENILYRREKAYLKMRSFNDFPSVKEYVFSLSKRHDNEEDVFWAYVAGLMDTDGSFSLKREKRNDYFRYGPIISLSMTDCRAIYHIHNNFIGANICAVKAKTATNGFCYRWCISSKNIAIKFLKKVIPFLFIKKNIASELLDFCNNSKSSMGCKGLPIDEMEYRQRCYESIVNLNKYGVVKPSLMDLKPLPGSAEGNKAEGSDATVNAVSERAPLKGDAEL